MSQAGSGGAPLRVEVDKRLAGFHLDVAFEGADRGVTALYGVSGAGKSLTLAAVAGALRPDRGRVEVGGEVLFDSARRIDLPLERRAVGWVFQDARLFPHLSVEANLRYGLRRARGRDAGVRFGETVEVLGVGGLLSRRPRDLSGGERQRVAIGRALLAQPRLLLMDEPLSALDAPRRAEILPFLERLKAAFPLPILYVTHALAEVVRLADRLVVIEAGRVAAQGALGEVMARGDLPLLAGRADAAVALDAVVQGHDAARGVTRLRAGAVELVVPRLGQDAGAAVRAVVLARDVLLALEPPRAISARNLLAARVEALAPQAAGVVMVRVRLGDGPAGASEAGPALLAALTRDAVQALALREGTPVWAILKSVAVEGATPGGLLALFEG